MTMSHSASSESDPKEPDKASGDYREIEYQAWLEAKADRVAELFQRGKPDLEGMPRLQRMIKNMVKAAGDDVSIEELVDRANKQFENPSQDSNSCEDK